MRPAPRGYSSARLHDLKFTFTPAGADDSVHSKAPLPRGGCLRSAQTGRVFEPILFFPFQKEKNGFNLPRKERGPVHTVVLNLTQKISAISRPLRSSLPPERSLRSAHRLSVKLPSKTNTCGPMSTRKGQAASVTLLRREQLRSASAPTFAAAGTGE